MGEDPTLIKGPPESENDLDSELEEEVEVNDLLLEEEIEDLFNKNTESFRCLAQILISRSSLLRHPLYHFPPLIDPGIDAAFNYVEPPLVIDSVGREKYEKLCKDFEIIPISRVIRSLSTETLDLKYYGLTYKQVRAIVETLNTNEFIKNVIFEDNWLSPDSCQRISDMLSVNKTIEYLNLKECRIKPEGATNLFNGLANTVSLKELDLSFNSLGDEGLLMLEDALCINMTIRKLNLSHNDLSEEAAKTLSTILDVNSYIQDLDLSWNGFYTGPGNKMLFSSLQNNDAIKILNLSWNGIGTKESATPIMKYLKKANKLQHFDISNNRLTKRSFQLIRNGLAKCTALISLRIGNNLLTPEEASSAAQLINTLNQLNFVDLENTFVNKDFVPFWKRQTRRGKSIIIGGVLGNYTIQGPDIIKLAFDRANFLAKKSKKNFGHFILQMPQQNLSKQEFEKMVKKFRMKKVDKDLVLSIHSSFPAKKQKIDLVEMRETYMKYYPDTALPPKKKGKGKGKGKGKKEPPPEDQLPPPPEGEPTVTIVVSSPGNEAMPLSAEEAVPAEGQTVVENEVLPEAEPSPGGEASTEDPVQGESQAEQAEASTADPAQAESQPEQAEASTEVEGQAQTTTEATVQ